MVPFPEWSCYRPTSALKTDGPFRTVPGKWRALTQCDLATALSQSVLATEGPFRTDRRALPQSALATDGRPFRNVQITGTYAVWPCDGRPFCRVTLQTTARLFAECPCERRASREPPWTLVYSIITFVFYAAADKNSEISIFFLKKKTTFFWKFFGKKIFFLCIMDLSGGLFVHT